MDCSVIIPARNEENRITRTLQSLKEQDFEGQYEIIVVVNASTDDTVKVAGRLADRVIDLEEGGVWRARNHGAKEAASEIILFIDADTIAPKNWISSFMAVYRDDSIMAAGGLLWPMEDTFRNKLSFRIFNWRTRRSRYAMLFGGNSSYRRDFFLKTGGFSTFSYMEDIELSVRVRDLHKAKAVLCPDIKVITSVRNHEGKRNKLEWIYKTTKEYKRIKGQWKGDS